MSLLHVMFKSMSPCCVSMPDMGAGCCLGPEGNGVSLGKGDEGEPGPPGSKEDKQSVLSMGGGNMEKEEGRTSRA
jgi:hypothetical protein